VFTSRTGLVLGFHGTDRSVVDDVINGRADLVARHNKYDWLGHGIYFWDNSYSRALDWATELSKRPDSHIKEPAVVGAILELGNCLDLPDYQNIDFLKEGYKLLQNSAVDSNANIPVNRGKTEDLLQRELDCAVIEALHEYMKEDGTPAYDSVRSVFWEGAEIYPTAGFREKNHIQVCIRSLDCIKEYFLPLPRVTSYSNAPSSF